MKKIGIINSIILLSMLWSNVSAQDKPEKISAFRDSTDHAYDISDWLMKKQGFLLVPVLITEPAVGYGAAAAAVVFHSSYSEKKGPPSMTGVIGGGTENGTWAAGVFHAGYWKQDRIRYTGAVARVYANLGFYGSGNLNLGENESINLNLDSWILFQQIKGRVGHSNFFIGGKYLLLNTDNTLEVPIDIPEFNGYEFSSNLSEVSLILNFDSRNNVFTPRKGFYADLSSTYSDTWFGGDALYGRISVSLLGYFPAGNKLMVSMRSESNYSLGDIPFWARPIVQLRGAPLMKYQDKNTTLIEAEISWDFYKRWSLIGFTGMGNAFPSYQEFDEGNSVKTLGTGFRYLLARKFGTKMGMDFAKSQDDFAFYIVFGTAWLK
jgi:hypothetical protein